MIQPRRHFLRSLGAAVALAYASPMDLISRFRMVAENHIRGTPIHVYSRAELVCAMQDVQVNGLVSGEVFMQHHDHESFNGLDLPLHQEAGLTAIGCCFIGVR